MKDRGYGDSSDARRGIRPPSGNGGAPPGVDGRGRDRRPGHFAGYGRFTLGERAPWSRAVLRQWLWIALVTVIATGGAAAFAALQTPVYRSQAEVAVYPASAGSSALQTFVMGTEKAIVSSEAVLSAASAWSLIPESKLEQGLSISVPVDTDLLVIAFSDPDPKLAQSGAEDVAEAYVAYRTPVVSTATKPSTPATPAAVVQAGIVTHAPLPTSPTSPSRWLIIGVALILGLSLGIGVALIRDFMDDGLRGAADLQTQSGVPVLAQIPAFDRTRRRPAERLAISRDPSSPLADAYRNLRTRVLQMAEWRRANLILVTSAGAEDHASVAANLATAIALSGRTVVLVCADLWWGRAQALFGLDDGLLGLAHLVRGEATLADALRSTEVRGLHVLPGGPPSADPAGVLQSPAFRKLLSELRTEADFVVIDAPPVLASADTAALADLGGMILLVADAQVSTRAEVRAATNELGHVRDDVIGWVLDNVRRLRLRPLPEPPLTQLIKARADSAHRFTAAPAGYAGPEPEREHEAASIHGEV